MDKNALLISKSLKSPYNDRTDKNIIVQPKMNPQIFKCLSMIQPGRTRQGVIILKPPLWLKLGRKIECHQHIHVLKHQVKIFHFTRVMGKT